jgi:hypothetical protein
MSTGLLHFLLPLITCPDQWLLGDLSHGERVRSRESQKGALSLTRESVLCGSLHGRSFGFLCCLGLLDSFPPEDHSCIERETSREVPSSPHRRSDLACLFVTGTGTHTVRLMNSLPDRVIIVVSRSACTPSAPLGWVIGVSLISSTVWCRTASESVCIAFILSSNLSLFLFLSLCMSSGGWRYRHWYPKGELQTCRDRDFGRHHRGGDDHH